jgi:N-acetylglucosaminyldiphosphoundecaprenol N-acetyl-beta-D-mannosaminyltransferase
MPPASRLPQRVFPALPSPTGEQPTLPEIDLRGVGIHAISEAETVRHILAEIDQDRGGWVVTPNLDHMRRLMWDESFRNLYEEADLRVVDGMLLVWACSLQRTPVPERVAGSDLLPSLSKGAAERGRSIFLLGGNPGSADGAAEVLTRRHPELRIAGTECPEFGFEKDPLAMGKIMKRLKQEQPDIVFVALGSPKQEYVIRMLKDELPTTWWLGVGISFSFLTGEVKRAPRWMRRAGLEWLHRLHQEPFRLFRRYVIQGLPFSLLLLARCAVRGTIPKGKQAGKYGTFGPTALLVDDDIHALDHLELLLSMTFPGVAFEKRLEADVEGDFDFYFLDNDFNGELQAARMAGEIRERQPDATIFAFSAHLDVGTLKGLINAGCDGVCDKSEPATWRVVVEHMRFELGERARRHKRGTRAFGGVRNAARSIELLLQDWNDRDGIEDDDGENTPREGLGA